MHRTSIVFLSRKGWWDKDDGRLAVIFVLPMIDCESGALGGFLKLSESDSLGFSCLVRRCYFHYIDAATYGSSAVLSISL